MENVSKKIENRLLKIIDSMKENDKLPSESDLCKEFSVSRMTVSRIYGRLAERKLIYRKAGSGSFVAPRDNSALDKTIYVLMPCFNFLASNCRYPLPEFWDAIYQESHRLGYKLVMIACSDTNNPHEINFKYLERIPEGAKVVVYSSWFSGTFDFLIERKCQVAYVNDQLGEDIFYDFIGSAMAFNLDRRKCGYMMVREMLNAGCKRPALISFNYRNKKSLQTHPRSIGFYNAYKDYLDKDPVGAECRYFPEEDGPDDLFDKLDLLYRQYQFDGLIFHCVDTQNAISRLADKYGLRIPLDLKLFCSNDDDDRLYLPCTTSCYPWNGMGKMIVKSLAAGIMPVNISYSARFNNYVPVKKKKVMEVFEHVF